MKFTKANEYLQPQNQNYYRQEAYLHACTDDRDDGSDPNTGAGVPNQVQPPVPPPGPPVQAPDAAIELIPALGAADQLNISQLFDDISRMAIAQAARAAAASLEISWWQQLGNNILYVIETIISWILACLLTLWKLKLLLAIGLVGFSSYMIGFSSSSNLLSFENQKMARDAQNSGYFAPLCQMQAWLNSSQETEEYLKCYKKY